MSASYLSPLIGIYNQIVEYLPSIDIIGVGSGINSNNNNNNNLKHGILTIHCCSNSSIQHNNTNNNNTHNNNNNTLIQILNTLRLNASLTNLILQSPFLSTNVINNEQVMLVPNVPYSRKTTPVSPLTCIIINNNILQLEPNTNKNNPTYISKEEFKYIQDLREDRRCFELWLVLVTTQQQQQQQQQQHELPLPDFPEDEMLADVEVVRVGNDEEVADLWREADSWRSRWESERES